ncbi:sulfatase [Actinoplanes sp. NPDC051851]|uniref:sulfatase family protein n=1 Tax=Actinoplanes sp. NPDC051851 TaxID=3154753 RepID=UPI00342E4F21
MSSPFRRTLGGLTAAAVMLASAGCSSSTGGDKFHGLAAEVAPAVTTSAPAVRPNIVFVLTDDLSKNLVQYMPNVIALQMAGTTFTNYTVTDSLCCPSRASIFTGQYPHNTGIYKNHGSDGGFRLFNSRGEEKSTYATDLQAAGYRTAFMGKYLNEYEPGNKKITGTPYTPPGWDDWVVGGNAYKNFDYTLNENGVVKKYGHTAKDYLNDVLSTKANEFVTTSAASGKPFMIEVASYSPHAPYTPAPQDTNAFPGLKAPRTAAYNTVPQGSAWLARHPALGKKEQAALDQAFRRRVQAVQSVDRMLGSLRETLVKAGVADNTVVIFSSDNGYHMGEYRLNAGKQTAFDTDVNVPLVVAGPDIPAGQSVTASVENIDLRPTFGELAQAATPATVDGHSFVPLLRSGTKPAWRTASLVEHHDPATDPADPDYEKDSINIPPSYDAIRTDTFTWVEYVDGEREFYDRTTDPFQLRNLAGTLTPQRVAQLQAAVKALTSCKGQAACWKAGQGIA